jgi:predicted esterase
MIMVHGRGVGPENILDLVSQLAHPAFAYLAPAAANRTWYPLSFLSDRQKNEPYLSSALGALARVVERVVAGGLPTDRIVLLGFSQGACLASEFALRHPARYGGIIAFSGGLIGPPGTTWPATGRLDGAAAFFGCSDVDAHVPAARVEESAAVYRGMGADVTARIYPGMGHTVIADEIDAARAIMLRVAGPPA